jgi:hypothetical protein
MIFDYTKKFCVIVIEISSIYLTKCMNLKKSTTLELLFIHY